MDFQKPNKINIKIQIQYYRMITTYNTQLPVSQKTAREPYFMMMARAFQSDTDAWALIVNQIFIR